MTVTQNKATPPLFRYGTRRIHSADYYRTCLLTIVHGCMAGWPVSTMRAALHGDGLGSPTGAEWSEAAVAGVLARIRARKSPWYIRLLELVFAGEVSREQAQAVLRSR